MLADLKGRIVASRSAAQASTDNFGAYQAFIGKIAKYEGDKSMQDLITAAKADVAKVATDLSENKGNKAHYIGVLDAYSTQLGTVDDKSDANTLYGKLKKDYENRVSKTSPVTTQTDIDALASLIKGVKGQADEAEKAYKSQVAVYDRVQKEWSDAYYKLTQEDESSHLKDDQATMTDYQTQLLSIKIEMDAEFAKGNSKVEDKTAAIEAISTEIADLLKTWEANYNEYIAADNKERYKLFESAVQITSEAYTKAIETIDNYSKIKDEGINTQAQNSLQAAHKAIYDYATLIRELKKGAKDTYDNIGSDLWDVENSYKNDADKYTGEINEALKEYTDTVNKVAVKVYNDVKQKVELAVTNAKASISGYSEGAQKDAFKDIENLLAEANTVVAQDDNGNYLNSNSLATSIDNYLVKLAGHEDMIAADKEAAAQKEWNNFIKTYNEKIEAQRANLGKYGIDEEEYNSMVAASVEAGQALVDGHIAEGNLFDNISLAKNTVTTNWNDQMYVDAENVFKANKANNDAADAVIEASAKAQEAIDALAEWAAQFILINGHDTGVKSMQDMLDNILANNEKYREDEQAAAQQDNLKAQLEALITSPANSVEAEYTTALNKEHAAVYAAIEALK